MLYLSGQINGLINIILTLASSTQLLGHKMNKINLDNWWVWAEVKFLYID